MFGIIFFEKWYNRETFYKKASSVVLSTLHAKRILQKIRIPTKVGISVVFTKNFS